MSKSLNEALDNVDMTYDQLIDISDNMIKPITEELDKIIKNASNNIENLTIDNIRKLILEISLKSYSLSEIKEKSALKSTCAETLRDEAYAVAFNKSDGAIAVKQNAALLETSYETLSEAIYNSAASMLKIKLDECHRIVASLQSVLMSRMQEAKLSTLNIGQEE